MKAEHLVGQHLQSLRIQDSQYAEVLNTILNYRATEKDREVTSRLLKKLVLNYSAAELQLFELNQLKNKFLGIAAHDLRNPLASIQGFSELLLGDDMGPLTEDQHEFIKTIHSLSQDMLNLVNDLLDVSVIESGKLELKRQPGSLKVLIKERIRINSILAEKKQIKLHESLTTVPEVSFDYSRITQVVDNLISNAIKYSPLGSNIFVSLSQQGMKAQISVRDEGPGIEPEEQKRLFGEFQRLSTKPTGDEKST
ncbi:MAG: HAMP domain-containing sensor histidine kinase, partial [Desulfobacterales bacterium]